MATELVVPSRSVTEMGVSTDAPTTFGVSQYIPMVGSDAPEYEGDYEVVPLAYASTTLDTANKLLRQDVTVTEIPYQETSNESGITVSIAS